MYTQEDCKKLKQAISEVKLLEGEANETGCYKNAVLVCLDAVLSINRKYYSFVVPRIKKNPRGIFRYRHIAKIVGINKKHFNRRICKNMEL